MKGDALFYILSYPILLVVLLTHWFIPWPTKEYQQWFEKHCLKGMQKPKKTVVWSSVQCILPDLETLCEVTGESGKQYAQCDSISTKIFEHTCILIYLKMLERVLCWIVPSFLIQVSLGHQGTCVSFGRQKQNSIHYSQKVTVVKYGNGGGPKLPVYLVFPIFGSVVQ